KDTSFDNTTGFNGNVYDIQFDSVGKIYVGGAFLAYKGVSNNYIIKLNTNGTKDTSFDNTTGFNGNVYDIQFDSVGKIYVGGAFLAYKGVSNNYIIKLN
ncbi:MAG: delta-60 repeat domain-containing protein, partial [bacterium]